jgi:hypothetical protein
MKVVLYRLKTPVYRFFNFFTTLFCILLSFVYIFVLYFYIYNQVMKNKNILIKGTLLISVFLFLGGLFLFGQAIDLNRKSNTVKVTSPKSKAFVVESVTDSCRIHHQGHQACQPHASNNDMFLHKSITVFIP